MQNATNIANAIAWPINVRLIFIAIPQIVDFGM
jgi:hypothetical protein